MSMMDYRIEVVQPLEPLQFAREELLRGLSLLNAPKMEIRLLSGEYELDGFTVDMNFPEGHGFIKGSNPRSVLFGVYRLLQSLGFRWPRPGSAGEIIPPPPARWEYIRHWEQASSAFRAICIEGADSRENLLDMVDWMAKHFMNAYYIQTDNVHAFLERWHRHLGNPLLEPEALTSAEATKVTLELVREIRRRGLTLMQYGHGATGDILGLSLWNWNPLLQPVTEETKKSFAEINGRRELWHNSPKYTQLCYGNPDIREKLARRAVELIEAQPEAERVGFFLSDHHHNFCECECCRKKRPSDWYVMILNRIDELLTAKGNPVRVGFAVYYDLLWPPATERIRNQERFFMLACPVTRSYSKPLEQGIEPGKTIPYLQNISPYPTHNEQLMAFFAEWQKAFPGECDFFEYHLMWDIHKSYGGCALARVLHSDAVALEALGMDGFVSCQNQRAFFPNGLCMHVMAAGLWNSGTAFEELANEYFRDAYGTFGEKARVYFEEVERLLPPPLLRGEAGAAQKQTAASRLLSGEPEALAREITLSISKAMETALPAQRKSWEDLALHVELFQLACKAFASLWTRGLPEAEPDVAALLDWARAHEKRLQGIWDVYEYLSVTITLTGVDRNRFMNRLHAEETLAEI